MTWRAGSLGAIAVCVALLASACSGKGSTDAGAGAGAGAAATTSTTSTPTWAYPDPDWEPTPPAEAGFDPVGIEELASYLEGTGSNCMAVIKDGLLVAERYWNGFDTETDQEIFSASKSVTSTIVGIAQDQGFLDIEEPASTYITEWEGTPSEDVTIRNLLSNDSGRYWDFRTDYLQMTTAADRSAFAIALKQQHDPGTVWVYNNSAIQTLEEVVQRATGQDFEEYAQANLFQPIGMTAQISRDKEGNPAAFMGVQASCRDLARFGYLFMREGEWAGNQVVSREWVQEATSASQELNTIYGYLWWRNSNERRQDVVSGDSIEDGSWWWPDAPPDAFAALGLGDQIVLVLPSDGIVVTRIGPYRQDETQRYSNTSPNEIARLVLTAAS